MLRNAIKQTVWILLGNATKLWCCYPTWWWGQTLSAIYDCLSVGTSIPTGARRAGRKLCPCPRSTPLWSWWTFWSALGPKQACLSANTRRSINVITRMTFTSRAVTCSWSSTVSSRAHTNLPIIVGLWGYWDYSGSRDVNKIRSQLQFGELFLKSYLALYLLYDVHWNTLHKTCIYTSLSLMR